VPAKKQETGPTRRKETDLPLSAPLTYSPRDVPPKKWTPNRNVGPYSCRPSPLPSSQTPFHCCS